jgi:hypothetical protein
LIYAIADRGRDRRDTHGIDTPRALWHTDPEFRPRILSEWDKIEPYKAKGFVAEWP